MSIPKNVKSVIDRDALKSIDRAIEGDPDNVEYRQTREIILQSMK